VPTYQPPGQSRAHHDHAQSTILEGDPEPFGKIVPPDSKGLTRHHAVVGQHEDGVIAIDTGNAGQSRQWVGALFYQLG
jgi:hypothetical protein